MFNETTIRQNENKLKHS